LHATTQAPFRLRLQNQVKPRKSKVDGPFPFRCDRDGRRKFKSRVFSGRDDALSGGVRKIEIATRKGKFHVWTKRVGNNPRIKLLTLHGGPGATHEYYEAFDSYLPAAGVEYYYYDQLGSTYSDQPDDPSLLDTARFVEEVQQVRQALGLSRDNFFLLGQSWGGMLALEYALKYQLRPG